MANVKGKRNANLSVEQQKEIETLMTAVKNIRQRGKFILSYMNLRKKSNEIRKSDKSDFEKKKDLVKLCEEIIKEMQTSPKK